MTNRSRICSATVTPRGKKLAVKNARGGMVFQPERGGLAVGGEQGGEDGLGGLSGVDSRLIPLDSDTR